MEIIWKQLNEVEPYWNNPRKNEQAVAVVAGLYVALTMINPIGYGVFQFRISEIICLLPFWWPKYRFACVLGVIIANLFSPLGVIDVLTGSFIALVAYWGIARISNKIIDITLYSLLCGVLVGAELFAVFGSPFWLNFLSVSASQLVVCILGLFILRKLKL